MASPLNSALTRRTTPPQPISSKSRYLKSPAQLQPVRTSSIRPISNVGPLSPVNQNGSFAFDRVIRSGKVSRRVKKKGAWKSSWKPAFLVLRPNLLSVYKDQEETELKASITLSDVTAVAPVKKSNHEHVFGIFTPLKNYHFSGPGARETSDWITLIRMEARTEEQNDLEPPSAGFTQADIIGDETTDLSADDDLDLPGSPETPHWSLSGQKSRVAPQNSADPRRTSGLAPYSGNEFFATSQSDFSDGFSNSLPGSRGYLSASIPVQPSPLAPILDETSSSSRPDYARGISYLSDTGITTSQPMSKSLPRQIPSTDPSRVVRQGNLKLQKTVSGVKQWRSIWMVLRSQTLSLYKPGSEVTPILVIPTVAIFEAAEINRKHKQNCFQVIGEEKTYRLQAETENELESWLGAFKSVLVKQEAERSSRHTSVGQSDQPTYGFGGRLPPSRDGTSAITSQLRNTTLEPQSVGARRVISPPVLSPTTYTQVTSPTT